MPTTPKDFSKFMPDFTHQGRKARQVYSWRSPNLAVQLWGKFSPRRQEEILALEPRPEYGAFPLFSKAHQYACMDAYFLELFETAQITEAEYLYLTTTPT